MNIERLKIMATILEEVEAGTWVPTQTSSIPKIRQGVGVGKVRFNMQVWGRPSGEGDSTTCGFHACAIGHACLDERLPELVSRGRMMILPQLAEDSDDEYAPWTSIQRYFGISKEQSRNLFDSHRYTPGGHPPQPGHRSHQHPDGSALVMSTDTLTIAYMVKGATGNLNRLTKAVAVNSEGELEYLQEVVDLADTVEEQFKAYYSNGNYSGVFVYDVAEPIGQWITDQTVLDDHIPSKGDVAKKAAELIVQHIDN